MVRHSPGIISRIESRNRGCLQGQPLFHCAFLVQAPIVTDAYPVVRYRHGANLVEWGGCMVLKQVSVFLENKSGRLAEVAKVMGENDIDISALSIADTTDFGILRLIVNKPDKAVRVLDENGFTVGTTEVIAISVEDQPGGLAAALNTLDQAKVDIEYMYAFIGNRASGRAMVIIRVENPETAIAALKQNGIDVLPSADVYRL